MVKEQVTLNRGSEGGEAVKEVGKAVHLLNRQRRGGGGGVLTVWRQGRIGGEKARSLGFMAILSFRW